MTSHSPLAVQGIWQDRLLDETGRVIHDSGLRRNTILVDCRRVLAGFMLGAPDTLGIQALHVGAGLEAWDDQGPPAPQTSDGLADAHPFVVPLADLDIAFLDPNADAVSLLPTNRIRIRTQLGPNMPPWPDADHANSTLREFGLAARLNGANVLINLVRHPAIAKDPASTLERTIWLVF